MKRNNGSGLDVKSVNPLKRAVKFVSAHLYGFVVGIFLGVLCASLVLLLVWGVFTAFKDRADFVQNKLGFPTTYYISNYVNAFKNLTLIRVINGQRMQFDIFSMFFNTVLYAGGSALINTLTCCIVAYLCSKYKYRFSKFLHSLVVAVMIIPIVGAMPSMIIILDGLHLYNSIWALWIQNFSFRGVYFLIFYATFESLPWEYGESAFIDGASHVTVMFKIMIPLVMNTFYVMFLLSFVGLWNEYQAPMVYWQSHPTIAVGLFAFMSNPTYTIPEQIACCVITVIPILIIFLIFKDKMMGNLTLGGLKG